MEGERILQIRYQVLLILNVLLDEWDYPAGSLCIGGGIQGGSTRTGDQFLSSVTPSRKMGTGLRISYQIILYQYKRGLHG